MGDKCYIKQKWYHWWHRELTEFATSVFVLLCCNSAHWYPMHEGLVSWVVGRCWFINAQSRTAKRKATNRNNFSICIMINEPCCWYTGCVIVCRLIQGPCYGHELVECCAEYWMICQAMPINHSKQRGIFLSAIGKSALMWTHVIWQEDIGL